jgi:glycerol-3-phosphate O-acyltransferase
LVLEAETLIEDWLKDRGRARYIIEDDEFSRVDRWVVFFRKLVGMDAACVMRFGKPIDPFGNPVDDEGMSIVPGGRTIDPATYVSRDGRPGIDAARDAAYTRELASILVERFCHESVIMATQLVAHVLFRHLVGETPKLDLYARLRLRGEISMPVEAVHAELGEARDRLKDLDLVRLSPFVRTQPPDVLLHRVLEIFHGYHAHVAIHRDGDRVVLDEPTLLLYYQNRLIPFAERIAPPGRIEAAREIARIEAPG